MHFPFSAQSFGVHCGAIGLDLPIKGQVELKDAAVIPSWSEETGCCVLREHRRTMARDFSHKHCPALQTGQLRQNGVTFRRAKPAQKRRTISEPGMEQIGQMRRAVEGRYLSRSDLRPKSAYQPGLKVPDDSGCHHRPAITTPSETILCSPVKCSPTTST